ncbi:hypothetical protein GOODEAATRI_025476 [Goodea atripinnis]|uniref:Uncharacterized protein n=1 Tax=Goodea atripinnis TaxID=208336 RepID=A0ABV0N5K4_9TELE
MNDELDNREAMYLPHGASPAVRPSLNFFLSHYPPVFFPFKSQTCATHKINVNWRSLVLITVSQRNLLCNRCLHCCGSSTGGGCLEKTAVRRYRVSLLTLNVDKPLLHGLRYTVCNYEQKLFFFIKICWVIDQQHN